MPVPVERGRHRRSLLREQAYESLRDAIVDGTLAPGEKLRDPELEEWLGVSRTPIREALARLEASGLVHTVPGRSTVVSAIEDRAVLNAQDVAAAMHALAVRTAVPLMGKADYAQMSRANEDFAAALATGDADAAIRAADGVEFARRGDHDDPDPVAIGPQPLQHLQTRHVRQVDIEQDQVGAEFMRGDQRLAAGARHSDDSVAVHPLDEAAVDLGDHEVVVDDQHVTHRCGPPAGAR